MRASSSARILSRLWQPTSKCLTSAAAASNSSSRACQKWDAKRPICILASHLALVYSTPSRLIANWILLS